MKFEVGSVWEDAPYDNKDNRIWEILKITNESVRFKHTSPEGKISIHSCDLEDFTGPVSSGLLIPYKGTLVKKDLENLLK